MLVWIRLTRKLAVLILLGAFAFVAFTHHAYWLWGDAELAFRQGQILRDGYFARNLAAMTGGTDDEGEPLKHEVLAFEGGFPFFLYIARFAGARAPFLLNVLLVTVLLGELALLVALMDDRRDRGALAAMAVPAFVLVHPAAADALWQLALPYRDTLAYVLALASFCALLHGLYHSRQLLLWALTSGALMGLAAWARFPVLILAFIPILYLLFVASLHNFALAMQCVLVWVGGLVAGLTPFFAQNIFEGRLFFAAREGSLLLGASSMDYAPEYGYGWDTAHFKRMIVVYGLRFLRREPIWMHLAVLVSVVMWPVDTSRARRYWFLLGPVILLLLFTSCYSRLVPRSLILTSFFYTAIPATFVAWFLGYVMGAVRDNRLRAFAYTTSILLIVLNTALIAAARMAPLDGVTRQWREAQRFTRWMKEHFTARDYFLTYDYPLRLWLGYFRPRTSRGEAGGPSAAGDHTLTWNKDPRDRRPDPVLADLVASGTVYFVSLADPTTGTEQPSWWKDAILNEYDLDPTDLHWDLDVGRPTRLVLYRVAPRTHTNVTVQVLPGARTARALYVYGRAAGTTAETIRVAVSWPGSAAPIRAELGAGPNLIRLPAPLASPPASITIQCAEPVPQPLEAEWLEARVPVTIPLSEYDRPASSWSFFSEADLISFGFKHWQRDWGGYDERSWRSTPYFVLRTNTVLRLPSFPKVGDEQLIVRLHYLAFAPNEENAVLITPYAYQLNGHVLRNLRIRKGDPAPLSRMLVGVRFIHELRIPASVWQGERRALLQPEGRFDAEVPLFGLILRKVEFSMLAPRRKPAAPSAP